MEQEKEKPLIVLVPGMFSWGEVYLELKKEFETIKRRVRVVDFPMRIDPEGYVYSGPCQTDFWDKLSFLVKMLKMLNGPYVLVGHSAGALLVLKAATLEGINPERIFLISPAPPSRVMALYPSVVRSFWFVLRTPFFASKSFWISNNNFQWAMANTLSEDQVSKVHKRLRSEFGGFIQQVGLPWFDSSRATMIDFEKVGCPVDIFIGSDDRVTPFKASMGIKKAFAELNPDLSVRVLKLEGLCHWLLESVYRELVFWIDDPDSIDFFVNL